MSKVNRWRPEGLPLLTPTPLVTTSRGLAKDSGQQALSITGSKMDICPLCRSIVTAKKKNRVELKGEIFHRSCAAGVLRSLARDEKLKVKLPTDEDNQP